MDCQLIMALFSNMYYQSFIAIPKSITVEHLLYEAVVLLNTTQQLELYHALGEYLLGQKQLNRQQLRHDEL